MGSDTLTYNRCSCEKCGSQFATVVGDDTELAKESCPNCGTKGLKIVGQLSQAEIQSIFYSGG